MPNTRDDEQRHRLARAILAQCVVRHGGLVALATHLGVEREQLIDWVGGREDPPVAIVKKAVEPFLKADQ